MGLRELNQANFLRCDFIPSLSLSQFVPSNMNSTFMEGLHSSTPYVITMFPVHGLAIEGIPPNSSQSIIVTDRGKTWKRRACNRKKKQI